MKKHIRNVNVKNTFNTIIFSLIALLFLFVPFSIKSSSNFVMLYEKFPIIGDEVAGEAISGLLYMLVSPLYEIDFELLWLILDGLVEFSYYLPVILFAIFVVDLVFAITLLIFRRNFIRVLFKILSIFLGLTLILIAIILITYMSITIIAFGFTTEMLFNDAGMFSISSSILISLVISVKQFTWFKKLY